MIAPEPFYQCRGTPIAILNVLRALDELGYGVDLVTYPFGEDIDLAGLTILRTWRPPLIRDVKIGPSLAKIFLDMPLYITTARALRRTQYDVLHTHEEAAFFGVGGGVGRSGADAGQRSRTG